MPGPKPSKFVAPAAVSGVEDREGTHRRAGAALELQWNPEELHHSLSDEFLKVHQPFPMAYAKFATEPVLGEDVVAWLVVEGPSTPCIFEPRAWSHRVASAVSSGFFQTESRPG